MGEQSSSQKQLKQNIGIVAPQQPGQVPAPKQPKPNTTKPKLANRKNAGVFSTNLSSKDMLKKAEPTAIDKVEPRKAEEKSDSSALTNMAEMTKTPEFVVADKEKLKKNEKPEEEKTDSGQGQQSKKEAVTP